jgi:hypothetical protein
MIYTENTQDLYDEYEKLNFMIANDDIFNSPKAYLNLKQFITENNISSDTINEFDILMEKQCNEGNTMCKLETLSDIEYISLMVMLGRITKTEIMSYMNNKKVNVLELCNGFIIRQFGKDQCNYVVDFPTENGIDTMKLELFITLNKVR